MDGIPFEELDPCCQKEVLLQRREKEFKEKIKKFDRSNLRNNEKKLVFKNITSLSRCDCCHSSSDYPLLTSLRSNNSNQTNYKEDKADKEEDNDHSEEDNEDDEDDDFDIDLDDFKTPSELLRIEEFKTKVLRRENYQSLGFLVHLRESSNHLLDTIQNISVPIIIHVYFSDELISASLDLVLEKLAFKYCGTLFRRISILDSYSFLDYFRISYPQSPILLVINDGNVVSSISSFLSFHSGNEYILQQPVEDYLDHLHVLSKENKVVENIKQYFEERTINFDDIDDNNNIDNNGKSESYCDFKGCNRYYPHSHISESNKNLQYKKSTEGDGTEVFSKDYLSKF